MDVVREMVSVAGGGPPVPGLGRRRFELCLLSARFETPPTEKGSASREFC
jgi:hypothetical protein